MTNQDLSIACRRDRLPFLLLSCFVFALFGITTAVFAANDEKKSFDLPSDTAERSLRLFSVQSGIPVMFPTQITRDIRTQSVKGEFTPRAALDRMLDGTGLVVAQDDQTGSLTVQRRPNDPNAQRVEQETSRHPIQNA